jgi:hypothetical protein
MRPKRRRTFSRIPRRPFLLVLYRHASFFARFFRSSNCAFRIVIDPLLETFFVYCAVVVVFDILCRSRCRLSGWRRTWMVIIAFRLARTYVTGSDLRRCGRCCGKAGMKSTRKLWKRSACNIRYTERSQEQFPSSAPSNTPRSMRLCSSLFLT